MTGADTLSYTPTAPVRVMRRHLALIPSAYAQPDSALLLPEDIPDGEMAALPYRSLCHSKRISIVSPESLREFAACHECEPEPWGWNRATARLFLNAGIDSSAIPTDSYLRILRHESSRLRTADFFASAGRIFPGITPPIAFDNIDDALAFRRQHNDCWFKTPWSSSGRGNLHCEGLNEEKIHKWLAGTIRRQGAVTAEQNYPRRLDFASLWRMMNGKALFAGFSVFKTDSRGKYLCNYTGSQEHLRSIIAAACRWSNDILEAQREFLEMPCRAMLKGPVGFDMLATDSGEVNPCVEINRRYTMGFVALGAGKDYIPQNNV